MDTTLRTIIVPVDETSHSESVIPVAAALARHTQAEIELVTVDAPHSQKLEMTAYHERLAREHLGGLRWHSQIVVTSEGVAEALVRRSDQKDHSLLCLSTHARNALGDIVLGSVGDRVVELAHGWALLVGPKCDRSPAALTDWLAGPVNVFVDGSDLDEQTAEVAFRWASATGQSLSFASVVQPDAPAIRHRIEQRLIELVASARDRGLHAGFHLVESFDIVGSAVRTSGARGGSVVIGTHQRSALARMVAGSAAIWTTHRANCPVLIAAHPAPVLAEGRSCN